MTHRQMTLATEADGGFEKHRKSTRRDIFLAEMDEVVPWKDLCAQIEPVYPKGQERGGRRPIGLERMLSSFCCHQRFCVWSVAYMNSAPMLPQ